MQRTIRALGIKLRVLPAFQVLARQVFLPWNVLAKEELLLRHQFQANSMLQIEEAYLLIFVIVEPVESFFDDCFLRCEAPALDNLMELLKSYESSVIPVELVKRFSQRLVLGLELGQEFLFEGLPIASQNSTKALLSFDDRSNRFFHIEIILRIFVRIVPKVECLRRLDR